MAAHGITRLVQRCQAGRTQVGAQHAAIRFHTHHVDRPRHRIGRHRRAAGHGLDHHQTEGIRHAREHHHIRGTVDGGQILATQHTEPARIGKAGLELVFRRAGASHPLFAGQIQLQELVHLLFHGQTAHIQEHRHTGLARQALAFGLEGIEVHPARPQPRLLETARLQVFHDRRSGRQRGTAGVVEAAQRRVADARRQLEARMHVLGKAAVVGRGERPAMAQRHATCQPAQRAFGGDVQAIRIDVQNALFHLLPRGQRQRDFRVGRARHGAEIQRREDGHFMPHFLQMARGHLQRAHHAVHLRLPGIGNDQNLHGGDSPLFAADSAPAPASMTIRMHLYGLLMTEWLQDCHL